MSLTITQWSNKIAKMDTNSLQVLAGAFLNISMWKDFTKEYSWTGFGNIGLLIRNELKERTKALARGD